MGMRMSQSREIFRQSGEGQARSPPECVPFWWLTLSDTFYMVPNIAAIPGKSSFLLTRPWDRIQFAESCFALGRGAKEGVYPRRYSTDRATRPQGKTASARRVAALLACGFVARRVTERCGYAPLLVPRHKPKSPATNCVLSHGLVSICCPGEPLPDDSRSKIGRARRWQSCQEQANGEALDG